MKLSLAGATLCARWVGAHPFNPGSILPHTVVATFKSRVAEFVMNNYDNNVQISDSDLSSVVRDKHMVIANMYGTVTHHPPEFLRDGVVSCAGDIYSFGVFLWQVE